MGFADTSASALSLVSALSDWGEEESSCSLDGLLGPCLLDVLPDSVLSGCLIPKLEGEDRKAFRGVCTRNRQLVNQQVQHIRLAASSIQRQGAEPAPRLGDRCPAATALSAYDETQAPVTDQALSSSLEESPVLLTRLQEVDLKQCHYVGRRLLHFLAQHCTSLRCLRPSRWTDNTIMWEIEHFGSLRELHLGDADVDILTIDAVGLSVLSSLPHLELLSLQRCRWIGDDACMAIAQVSSLKDLDMSHTDVGARGLGWLATLPNLHTLRLTDCRNIDAAALQQLAPLPGLGCLVLRNTGVTNAGLGALGAMRLLAELDLGNRFELTDEGLQSLAACPSLRRLSAGSFNLQRPAPRGGFRSLAHLGFGGSFANKGLDLLFPLPTLKSLHVQGIDAVTNNVMKHVSSQASLEELVLRAGYTLTDACLDSLSGLPNLSSLSLSACPSISTSCLRAFVGAHQRLGRLLVRTVCPLLADSRDALCAMVAR